MCRTIQLFYTRGSVSKRPHPKEKPFHKLTMPAKLLVLHLVMDKPGIYLHEIQRELEWLLLKNFNHMQILAWYWILRIRNYVLLHCSKMSSYGNSTFQRYQYILLKCFFPRGLNRSRQKEYTSQVWLQFA